MIGILVLALLRFGLFGYVTIGLEGSISIGAALDNILLASVLIWETSRAVVLYFQRRYALSHLSTKRFGLEVFGVFMANGIIYSALVVIHEGLQVFQKVNPLFLLYGLFYTFLYGVLVAAFYELLFYMEAWKKAT